MVGMIMLGHGTLAERRMDERSATASFSNARLNFALRNSMLLPLSVVTDQKRMSK